MTAGGIRANLRDAQQQDLAVLDRRQSVVNPATGARYVTEDGHGDALRENLYDLRTAVFEGKRIPSDVYAATEAEIAARAKGGV